MNSLMCDDIESVDPDPLCEEKDRNDGGAPRRRAGIGPERCGRDESEDKNRLGKQPGRAAAMTRVVDHVRVRSQEGIAPAHGMTRIHGLPCVQGRIHVCTTGTGMVACARGGVRRFDEAVRRPKRRR